MNIREVAYNSDDYRRILDMRYAILRAPLELDWSTEDLAAEAEELHFGLFDDYDALVACAVVRLLSENTAKLRQMAVAGQLRGIGAGRQMLAGVEAALRPRGIRKIEMDARKTAIGFYEKSGYHVEGGEFIQVTIPHFKMVKDI
jgi:predicted GNAT family N-acyltransferase